MPLPRCRPGFSDHIFKSAAGGYTCGKWSVPTTWISRAFADRGYGVVSVGYRLQPQASLPDMIDDVLDAAAWCHSHVAPLGLDPERWAVGGASSGATLAAMVALNARHKPKAFMNIYGLIDTEDYLEDEAKRAPPPPDYVVASEEELEAAVQDWDPANAVVQNPWAGEMPPNVPLEEARAAFGLDDWEPTRAQFVRSDMYSYVAKNRNLMDIVYRRAKFADHDAFRNHVRAHSPYQVLQGRKTFPPTFFMHGTGDDIVRVDQSWKFAERLVEMDVDIAEVYDEGKGHVYDFAFEQPGDDGWEKNIEPCMAFLDKHLK